MKVNIKNAADKNKYPFLLQVLLNCFKYSYLVETRNKIKKSKDLIDNWNAIISASFCLNFKGALKIKKTKLSNTISYLKYYCFNNFVKNC